MAINGGVKTLEEAEEHLKYMDGVMIGREAYQNPYMMAEIDQRLYGENKPVVKRSAVVESMYPYIEEQLGKGTYLGHITRHMLGLFQNMPGHRAGAAISVKMPISRVRVWKYCKRLWHLSRQNWMYSQLH